MDSSNLDIKLDLIQKEKIAFNNYEKEIINTIDSYYSKNKSIPTFKTPCCQKSWEIVKGYRSKKESGAGYWHETTYNVYSLTCTSCKKVFGKYEEYGFSDGKYGFEREY
jgi:hypothetical protein